MKYCPPQISPAMPTSISPLQLALTPHPQSTMTDRMRLLLPY
jgi:hypothetical protein